MTTVNTAVGYIGKLKELNPVSFHYKKKKKFFFTVSVWVIDVTAVIISSIWKLNHAVCLKIIVTYANYFLNKTRKSKYTSYTMEKVLTFLGVTLICMLLSYEGKLLNAEKEKQYLFKKGKKRNIEKQTKTINTYTFKAPIIWLFPQMIGLNIIQICY